MDWGVFKISPGMINSHPFRIFPPKTIECVWYEVMDAGPVIENDPVKGKVIYFLILVILNQFIYPITQFGTAWLILYQVLYASMFAAGIYIARR